MSDHEVNIKILLDILVREKVIASRDARNGVLQQMTDNVSELVLDDNRYQARAITLDGVRSVGGVRDVRRRHRADDRRPCLQPRGSGGAVARRPVVEPDADARPAAAAAGGAARAGQDARLRPDARLVVPRQSVGPAAAHPLLPGSHAAAATASSSRSTRSSARSSRRSRSTT